MDPVWSNIAAPAPKWVISSIQIAPPTHFWVQNLENPQIRDPKMLKIMKNKKSQTCPEIIPTHLLRILRALQHLKTYFSYCFRSLTSHPIPPSCDQDTKNDENHAPSEIFDVVCVSVQSKLFILFNILMPAAPPGPQALVLVFFKDNR